MNLEHGVFTISLDFELYWGVRDKRSIEEYQTALRGARKAVPQILQLFHDNDIHATWAAVGFLFFEDAEALKKNFPKKLPNYQNKELSPYHYIEQADEIEQIYHFAPELIDLIRKCDGQEIGTHSFSHYYCLEKGQSLPEFEQDIIAAIKIANKKKLAVKSFVFPRNQWNKEYLATLNKLGVRCYRGNESNWMYSATHPALPNKFKRAFRLIDTYINISGHHTHEFKKCTQEKPFNFPASRFLRPYSKKISLLDGLKLQRIKQSMDNATINNQIFHLWWHPHNFGVNTSQNISFLEKIIKYYRKLNQIKELNSLNMGELCRLAENRLSHQEGEK